MADSLRARYMDNEDEFSFRDYYGALVEHIGEDALRQLLPGKRTPGDRTPAEWRALVADDFHLNNVPLKRWDDMSPFVRGLVITEKQVAITGSRAWSLGDSVCVLKETARRYAELADPTTEPES